MRVAPLSSAPSGAGIWPPRNSSIIVGGARGCAAMAASAAPARPRGFDGTGALRQRPSNAVEARVASC